MRLGLFFFASSLSSLSSLYRRGGRVVTIALAAMSLECSLTDPKLCTLVDCGSGAIVELRVHNTLEELGRASIRFCHGTECTEKPSSLQPTFGTKAWWLTIEQPTGVSIEAETGTAGWSTLRLTPRLDQKDYLPDGDRYTAEVRAPDGKLLIAFDRNILYAKSAPNGEECGPRCSSGTLRGYEASAPQLTCTGKACTSGVQFDFVVPVSSATLKYQSGLRACRNAVCATSKPSETTVQFEGDLTGATLVATPVDETSSRVVLTFLEDPSLLANGDTYSLTKVNTASVLFEKVVDAYEESYPNGEACDLHPCRRSGTLPGTFGQ